MPIRDPRLTLARAHQRGYFPLSVTIEEAAETKSPATGEITKTWTALDGHVGLDCRVVSAAGSAGEERRDEGTIAADARVVTLKDYRPAISTKHRAVVLGQAWNILAVEHDGQQAFSRLLAELVT